MSVHFWDTNLFIYLIEQDPTWHDTIIKIRQDMLAKDDILVTSTLTLGEVLLKPLRENRLDLAEKYRSILTSSSVILINFDESVAERFAKIRSQYGKKVKPPDAIQLACAGAYRVDLFITNDERLEEIMVDGVSEIVSLGKL